MYPFIEAEQAGKHNVKRACKLLQVSRSAYYRRPHRSDPVRTDADLTARIIAIHDTSRGTYGAPRVHAELAEGGHRHGRTRIAPSARVGVDLGCGRGSAGARGGAASV
ncbi:IS3 family transposase [Dactylosporangium sp. NPDC050588]|uniref:IS3 family transposase n=1 Tax=Dactylosporangium sp. NPDC050588 TaxID=3157211 RepID=UPI0033FED4DF